MSWKNDNGMDIVELATDNDLKVRLQQKARRDAEVGIYDEPYKSIEGTYADQAVISAYNMVYFEAYYKRKERLVRMK